MIFEYALDPALLDNWKDCRFFLQSFGPDKGRLVADFPRKWKRAVLEAIRVSTCGDVEKKRIKEALKHLAAPTLYSRTARHWAGAPTWLENAVREDADRPFHAIVFRDNGAAIPIPDDHFIQEDDLLDRQIYWECENTLVVPRNAMQMAAPATPLLSLAQHILFVDPYFDPDKGRFLRPLIEFLKIIASRPGDIVRQRIEYHVSDRIAEVHFAHVLEGRLKPNLPIGISVSFVRWPEAEMHDRHIVTNIGALTYGQGLDEWEGGPSPQEVLIHREGNAGWEHLWRRYSQGVPFLTISN